MNKVLIVIDAQEDFTRGALRNEEAIAALPIISKAVDYASFNFDHPIIYTKDTHFDNYLDTQEGKNLPIPHCIKDTRGWRLCREVLTDKCKIYEKEQFGYKFWRYDLENVEEIWLCGFCTDICVMANFQLLKAEYPEIPIYIIEDACAGVTPELHDAAIKVMKSCQAKIVKSDELIKEN